jgi:hypothetical protein
MTAVRTFLVLVLLSASLWIVLCYDPCFDDQSPQYGQILAEREVRSNESFLYVTSWDTSVNITDSTGCYFFSLQFFSADSVYRMAGDERWSTFTFSGILEDICTPTNSTPPYIEFYAQTDWQIITILPETLGLAVIKDINMQGNIYNENMTSVNVTITEAIFNTEDAPVFTTERNDYKNYGSCNIKGRADEVNNQFYSHAFNFTFAIDQGAILQFSFPAGVPAQVFWRNYEYYLEQCLCVFYSETDGTTSPHN